MKLVEPRGRERKLAIEICRANAYLKPDDGRPEPNRERAQRTFNRLYPLLPRSKWLWVWNNAPEEWDPRASTSAGDSNV